MPVCEKRGNHESFRNGLPFFTLELEQFLFTLPFFPTLETFFSPSKLCVSPPFGTFLFHPSKPGIFTLHPVIFTLQHVSFTLHLVYSPFTLSFSPSTLSFQSSAGEAGNWNLHRERCHLRFVSHVCTCQTLCFHLNNFLLLTLRTPPETAQRLSGTTGTAGK